MKRNKTILTVKTSALSALLFVSSCGGCGQPPEPQPQPQPQLVESPAFDPATISASTKNRLTWKRHKALEADVAAALELDKTELCNELGQFSCVDVVHRAALGGNEPFVTAQYEAIAAPLPTTAVGVDRVLMSACITRTNKDAAGPAVVFTDVPFDGRTIDDAAADATSDALVRRFLHRPPTAAEKDTLRGLMVDDDGAAVSPRDFAILACVAVGTVTENVFF
jgi:hypothetical protein